MQYISTWQHLVVVKISLHLPNTIQQDTVLTCLTRTCLHHHSLQDIHKSPDIFSPHKQTSKISRLLPWNRECIQANRCYTHTHRGLAYSISVMSLLKKDHIRLQLFQSILCFKSNSTTNREVIPGNYSQITSIWKLYSEERRGKWCYLWEWAVNERDRRNNIFHFLESGFNTDGGKRDKGYCLKWDERESSCVC